MFCLNYGALFSLFFGLFLGIPIFFSHSFLMLSLVLFLVSFGDVFGGNCCAFPSVVSCVLLFSLLVPLPSYVFPFAVVMMLRFFVLCSLSGFSRSVTVLFVLFLCCFCCVFLLVVLLPVLLRLGQCFF